VNGGTGGLAQGCSRDDAVFVVSVSNTTNADLSSTEIAASWGNFSYPNLDFSFALPTAVFTVGGEYELVISMQPVPDTSLMTFEEISWLPTGTTTLSSPFFVATYIAPTTSASTGDQTSSPSTAFKFLWWYYVVIGGVGLLIIVLIVVIIVLAAKRHSSSKAFSFSNKNEVEMH
jgi:hypothetical protein